MPSGAAPHDGVLGRGFGVFRRADAEGDLTGRAGRRRDDIAAHLQRRLVEAVGRRLVPRQPADRVAGQRVGVVHGALQMHQHTLSRVGRVSGVGRQQNQPSAADGRKGRRARPGDSQLGRSSR
ncbi:MAG: hypothetical protein HND48_21815 [Chloroflexi bacterium]|nr:hypothetical protein [Chloroflexota bacterium]